MSGRPRAGALPGALLLLAMAAGPAPAAASPARAATDAYAVAAPARPWVRAAGLEPAGQLSWTAGAGPTRRLLRVGYEATVARDPAAAVDDALARTRAAIRSDVDGRDGVERGGFEADSIVVAGGLRWRGFRVVVRVGPQQNVSWRWVALHPQFPARRTLFTLGYDEAAPIAAPRLVGEADARALAASLRPAGAGLAGSLADAWLDARATAFAARIDSAQKLCWRDLPEGAGGREHLGYGRGLALGGDFFLYTNQTPRDSLVDPAPLEYGAAFDRNGDGRIDLVLLDRGVRTFAGGSMQPTIALQGDEDFDGRMDALLVEDVDADGDGRADARLLLRDRDGDGRIDEARTFDDAAATGAPRGTRVAPEKVRRLDGAVAIDPGEWLRTGTLRRAELDAARAACPLL